MKRLPLITAAALLLSGAPAPQSATFTNVADKQRLFAVTIEQDGYWSFCLAGKKPAKDLFLFHVTVARDAGTFRADGVRTVRAEETAISVCARQDPKSAGEPRLKKGERVEVVSIGTTRGPVELTLTVSEVKP